MIKTASELPDAQQPKCLLVMDPWCYPIHEELASGAVSVKCPMQMIHSETFHSEIPLNHFDSWGSVQLCLKNSSKQTEKHENVIVKGTFHNVQTDFATVWPWELCVLHLLFPNPSVFRAYQLHTSLMLSFVDKIEGKKRDEGDLYFDPTKANL